MRAAAKGSEAAPTSVEATVTRTSANPVLQLQRKIGNRATGQVLARAPATTDHGTVKIGKLPAIKIVGGNAGEWATKEPRTLEITSKKGKHSAALARLSKDGSKLPLLKLTMPIAQDGQNLDSGSVEIEFGNATIAGYTVDGTVETWRAIDFDRIHRTKISHKSGI